MNDDRLVATLPTVPEVRDRIGFLLRELHVARRLLSVAALAEKYRHLEQPTQRAEALGV